MSNQNPSSNEPVWHYLEDPEIYDGWCLQFNPDTGEIKWRNAWFVDQLSADQKAEIEIFVKENLINSTQE